MIQSMLGRTIFKGGDQILEVKNDVTQEGVWGGMCLPQKLEPFWKCSLKGGLHDAFWQFYFVL